MHISTNPTARGGRKLWSRLFYRLNPVGPEPCGSICRAVSEEVDAIRLQSEFEKLSRRSPDRTV